MGITLDSRKDIAGDKIIIEGATDGTSIGNCTDHLKVNDYLEIGNGVQAELTIGTSAVLGKVGASPLVARKGIMLQAQSGVIYYGLNSGVTTANGIRAFNNQTIFLPYGETTDIYFIATGAGAKLRFQEVN